MSDDTIDVTEDEAKLATIRRNRKWNWISLVASVVLVAIQAYTVGRDSVQGLPYGWDLFAAVLWSVLAVWKAYEIAEAAKAETKAQVRILLDRVMTR